MSISQLHDVPVVSASLRLVASPPRAERPSHETDLAALCDAVAEALQAPVTIEDAAFNVLAFSDHRDVDDASRTASILGRRVPEVDAQRLTADGVMARLLSSDAPVVVAPLSGRRGRVAQRIRADKQTFGAIWVATDASLSADRLDELRTWCGVAARAFLRKRLEADHQLKDQSVQLSRLLAGEVENPLLDELGLRGGVSVLAVRPAGGVGHDEAAALDLQRLGSALRMHLSAVHPSCIVAPVDDLLYAVVPARGSVEVARQRAVDAAESFARSAVGAASGVTIGIGGPVAGSADLPRARADADGVLRLLGASSGAVVHADTVQVRVLMLELSDLVDDKDVRLVGPAIRLAEHDAATRSDLLRTVEVWLDSFGDVATTAEAVHVHPNTVRYRLRRAAEVGGLDLQCPQARYEAMVQIRLLRASGRVAQTV